MDFFTILQEAKKPSTTKINIDTDDTDTDNYEEVVPDKATIELDEESGDYEDDTVADDGESTDYTTEDTELSDDTDDDVSSDSDDGQEDDADISEDYSEDAETDDSVGDDDATGDADATDYVDQDDDDYSPEGEDSGEGSDMSEGGEAPVENDEDAEKNARLCDDFIHFFDVVKKAIQKVDEIDHSNINAILIIRQVKINLMRLEDYLFTYITTKFNKNKYVDNLYVYNYLIEAFKINNKLLEKINNFL